MCSGGSGDGDGDGGRSRNCNAAAAALVSHRLGVLCNDHVHRRRRRRCACTHKAFPRPSGLTSRQSTSYQGRAVLLFDGRDRACKRMARPVFCLKFWAVIRFILSVLIAALVLKNMGISSENCFSKKPIGEWRYAGLRQGPSCSKVATIRC